MKIKKHGDIIEFTCKRCGCIFTEVAKICYSSSGVDGSHYMMDCPDCDATCFTTDEMQKQLKAKFCVKKTEGEKA